MDLNNSNNPPITNNNHFLVRNRNLRNELLKQTDYYLLSDVYEKLTNEQKEEIKIYRQNLREFINENKSKYLIEGIGFIDFPESPDWCNIKLPKY
jgi:hypothetical protein